LTLGYLETTFEDFVTEAWRLKEKYASQITLLVGLESEYITSQTLTQIEDILQRHQKKIQLIVGSVHHVSEVPIDLDRTTFGQALRKFDSNESQLDTLVMAYLDQQYDLLKALQPEIIGHFDLCRLFLPDFSLRSNVKVWTRVERNVKIAIEYGALFEVNGGAFRKGWTTAYPGQDVFELILSMGGKFTLSDDSHGPHAVGLHYADIFAYLRKMQVKALWYLDEPKEEDSLQAVMCRKLVARQVVGDWWEDEFWASANVA